MKLFDKIGVTMEKVSVVALLGAIAPVVLPIKTLDGLAKGGINGVKKGYKKSGKVLKEAMAAKTMDEFEKVADRNRSK